MLLSNRMAGAESVDEIEGLWPSASGGVYPHTIMITCSSELPSAAIMVDVLKGRRAEEIGNTQTYTCISQHPPRHPSMAMYRHIYAPAVGTCNALC